MEFQERNIQKKSIDERAMMNFYVYFFIIKVFFYDQTLTVLFFFLQGFSRYIPSRTFPDFFFFE